MQGTLKFSELSFLNAFFPLRSDGRKGENLPVKSISPNTDGLKTSSGIHLLFVRTLCNTKHLQGIKGKESAFTRYTISKYRFYLESLIFSLILVTSNGQVIKFVKIHSTESSLLQIFSSEGPAVNTQQHEPTHDFRFLSETN